LKRTAGGVVNPGFPRHDTAGSEPVAPTARIPKSIDIFWREEETSAMIVSDEKLDRRARDHRAEPFDGAQCARVLQPKRVPVGEGRKFLFGSTLTH
jgi:hypothetical protein